jgi:hypothetical protein
MSARLAPHEVQLFFRLHRLLMFYVNEQLAIVPDITSPEMFSALSPEIRVQVRDALVTQPELIDRFVEENPFGLADEERSIIQSWEHFVAGRFFIFRHLKHYTVFLDEQQETAYGVLALSDPFEELISTSLPVLAETVLLPFRDKIVYDGLLAGFNISWGGGIKRSLNETYKSVKEKVGIATSLPSKPAATDNRQRQKKVSPPTPPASEVQPVLDAIIELTDHFCREYLNEEYAVLCRELAVKLARKRPTPLLRGKPVTWASGIVRTIGWVNFLNDPSQSPHLLLREIDERFGISESSGAAKLKEIRSMLRIHQLDPQWSLPSNIDDNPLVWMLEVNGLIVDVRHAPRELQEFAFERGLIPYIPADRE